MIVKVGCRGGHGKGEVAQCGGCPGDCARRRTEDKTARKGPGRDGIGWLGIGVVDDGVGEWKVPHDGRCNRFVHRNGVLGDHQGNRSAVDIADRVGRRDRECERAVLGGSPENCARVRVQRKPARQNAGRNRIGRGGIACRAHKGIDVIVDRSSVQASECLPRPHRNLVHGDGLRRSCGVLTGRASSGHRELEDSRLGGCARDDARRGADGQSLWKSVTLGADGVTINETAEVDVTAVENPHLRGRWQVVVVSVDRLCPDSERVQASTGLRAVGRRTHSERERSRFSRRSGHLTV